MPIGLSHSGPNIYRSENPSNQVLVGTREGVAVVERDDGGVWKVASRALSGRHISSIVVEPESGTIFAGAFFGGLHASTDGGRTWERRDNGIAFEDIFSMSFTKVDGNIRIYAGTEPAHLFYSDDLGANWTEMPSMRDVKTVDKWWFPGPPHIAHTKFITFDPMDPHIIYSCIEQGALLKSEDNGKTWREINTIGFYNDKTRSREIFYDVHKAVIDPRNREKIFTTGGAGLYCTEDGGKSWERRMSPDWAADVYPDALVMHPRNPDVIVVGAAEHNPATWRESKYAGGKVFRTDDGGKTWRQLRNGLPERMGQEVGAMCLEDWGDSFSLFAATTGGQLYHSEDGGESWNLIVENLTPISKKGHFMNLVSAGR